MSRTGGVGGGNVSVFGVRESPSSSFLYLFSPRDVHTFLFEFPLPGVLIPIPSLVLSSYGLPWAEPASSCGGEFKILNI